MAPKQSRRTRPKQQRPSSAAWGRATDKTPVVALVSRDTGEVRTKVVPNVTGANLAAAIAGNVEPMRTVLHTDGNWRYRKMAHKFAGHQFVDHNAGEYVRGDVSTNQAENFFSQLKRSIDGTHHHVSVHHLQRYLSEFEFRYTYRKDSDTERMARLIGRVHGRRLMYVKRAEREYPNHESFWG